MSKTVLALVDGFTPLIDGLVLDVGIIGAAVFGKAWRYCQMSDGVCKAAQDRIAQELGISRATVNSYMDKLTEAGYLQDMTPNLIGMPHIYRDTGRAGVSISFTGRCQKSLQGGVKEIDTKIVVKESIKDMGDKSPDISKMPMDWKLAHGQEITAEDVARMEDDKRRDAANLISIGFGISAKIAFNLAYAFQVARNITFPESKIKGQRKAIKEMLEMHVTPENVTEAVQQLTGKGMTVVDLFSVSKTAIDLANKPVEQYNPNEEHRL